MDFQIRCSKKLGPGERFYCTQEYYGCAWRRVRRPLTHDRAPDRSYPLYSLGWDAAAVPTRPLLAFILDKALLVGARRRAFENDGNTRLRFVRIRWFIRR